MENWYKVTMALEDWEPNKKGQQLIDDFGDILVSNGGPVEAALFSQKSEDRKTVCFYFSPRAAGMSRILVETHRAASCPAPLRGTVNLAVGDVRAVELLLPSPSRDS